MAERRIRHIYELCCIGQGTQNNKSAFFRALFGFTIGIQNNFNDSTLLSVNRSNQRGGT